jgi:hypothetical protein
MRKMLNVWICSLKLIEICIVEKRVQGKRTLEIAVLDLRRIICGCMHFSCKIDSMMEMMYAMMNLCACMWVLG